jgi:SAM-dependent methyltransferase
VTAFNTLAEDYDDGRLGYAQDVYNAIAGYGLEQRHAILDIGCGTGLGSAPFIESGNRVTGVDASEPMLDFARRKFAAATWIAATAENLPFENGSFDAVVSAQAFHHFNIDRALGEAARVLRARGVVAIWWKHLMSDDPVNRTRNDIGRELGAEPPPSGLGRGFKEFYAVFSETSLRAIPWRTGMTFSRYMKYERSRSGIRAVLGNRAEEYFTRLQSRLRDRYGPGDPFVPLGYMHYLYLAKK